MFLLKLFSLWSYSLFLLCQWKMMGSDFTVEWDNDWCKMDSYFLLEFSLIKSVTHWWFVQFQTHCAMQSAHRGTGAFRQIAQVWVKHFDDCSEEIQMLTCCVYLQLTSLYKMVPAFPHSVSAAVAPGSTVQRQINHSPCNHPWCGMAGYKPQLASLKTQAVSAQLCKCSITVSVVKELPQ